MQVPCLSLFNGCNERGLIKSEWKATENNRRAKYYALTEQGRKKLQTRNARMEQGKWRRSPESWRRRKRHVLSAKHSERTPIAVPKGTRR